MAIADLAASLAGASAASAGLILVFLGNTATAFDSYEAVQQDSVRARYRKRGGEAFLGFVLSLISCGLALVGQYLDSAPLAGFSALALFFAFVFVIIAAWQTYSDIS